ncbi:MAG TPA: DUF2332 domain-containing protein [Mycobacteriales bacterium]|nr:DUF2332 domain-containing protein [Mycobacteriales bacterium]
MNAPLEDRFRQQADQCRQAGSALTAALLEGAAGELAVPGPVRDLLAPLAGDPAGSVPSLRFAGALHRLVLERRAPALALHYPSVGGTAGPEGAWAAAREVVATERRLPDLVRAPVQTNEVGRSAVLYGGLLHVAAQTGLPVRLLEVGASAGLNLRVDAFAYEVGGRVLGDADSPVRLREPWSGSLPPDAPLRVTERLGCDPGPLDPASTADRLTLTSYVWADQTERVERLRGALAVAGRVPARVDALPASAFLRRELAQPVPGVATVVWHSVVWQYLDPGERDALDGLLAEAGERATTQAPLARLSLEPERPSGDAFRFGVDLTTWPGGIRRRLATARGHGPPVRWS